MSQRDAPWPLYEVAELENLPAPQWLVKEHITDGLTVIYGPPGAGKTFLALSMILAISTGRPWFGYETLSNPVLYVTGEGGGGLHRRIKAWRLDTMADSPALWLVIGTVLLTDSDHMLALRKDIRRTGARMLVVDTLARSMAGKDENSAQDMGTAVQSLDWLRREEECSALVVHHSGVDGSRPRGSTALYGAADTLIRVTQENNHVDVVCEKQKEAPRFPRLAFDLRPVGESVVLTSRNPVGFIPGH